MSKDKTKKLVGQPIMNQILRLVPKSKISDIVKDTQCDRYYKKIPLMKHLTTMLFGVLSRCNSIREICAGMLLCEGKLNHIGLEKVIPKSTLADANRDRNSEVFERLYYKLYFVTRMKDNAVYKVIKVIQENDVQTGIVKEEKIKLEYKDGKQIKTVTLRRITFVDDENRLFVFITNNMKISAEEVALIYKNRWQIELLFKKLKHNFQLKYFIGDTENAIKIQIWVTLIAHLLLCIIKKKANIRFAFSNIATIIRLHLMSYVDLIEFLKKPIFAWRVSNPVPVYQFKLF